MIDLFLSGKSKFSASSNVTGKPVQQLFSLFASLVFSALSIFGTDILIVLSSVGAGSEVDSAIHIEEVEAVWLKVSYRNHIESIVMESPAEVNGLVSALFLSRREVT